MAKIPFIYYVADTYQGDEREEFILNQDSRIPRSAVEDMGNPFYEVTLYCEIDTETGDVTLLRAEL